ncbi:Lipase (class 3) [Leptolyngbya sp. PCC 7375]|nr:Lipase (class 3) [Leptolyngbya sp. PCC 7375]DAC80091.1 TPA_exp: class III lipase [Leptolyngbya sp. PCC 7375]
MATADASAYNNGTYSFEQQIFSISWSTILSFNFKGEASEIASKTKESLVNVLEDKEIQKLIGVWNLVWGPGIYADSFVGEEKSLNMMFIVVPEGDPEQAVVAIAGTNGSSLMDWIVEDFNVKETVPWPYGPSSGEAEISKGTYFGLDKLVNLESVDPTSNASITAQQYLSRRPFKNIMVTGHSLGGALSPCYSLYLDETRSQWDLSESTIISCLPTAGPTPGDLNFSQYYDSKLSKTTHRQWNLMDVVPHAFNTELLAQVPDLYEPDLSASVGVKLLVRWIQRDTKSLDYLNIAPDAKGFPSKVFDLTDFISNDKYKAIAEDIEEAIQTFEEELKPFESHSFGIGSILLFLIQALIQHTIGYIAYFDIGDFSQRLTPASKQSSALLSKPEDGSGRLRKSLELLTKKPILLDLGQPTRHKRNELQAGEGPLWDAILAKVDQINKDKPNQGAQPVIFLVEDQTSNPSGDPCWSGNSSER